MSRAEPIWGTDVSSHQGVVPWRRVASEGYKFAISKATEGTYYADKYLKRNLRWSEKRGLIPGAYLFLTSEDAGAQVNRFLRAIGNSDGKLIAVDVEDPRWYGQKNRGAPSATDAWNAIHLLKEKIGDHPIILYSGNWYWSGVLGNPDVGSLVEGKDVSLWVSRYVGGAGYGSTLYDRVPDNWWDGEDGGGFGGYRPSILQFTEHANIAGQTMDANAFAGSIGELRRLASSSGGKNTRPVEPKMPAGSFYGVEQGEMHNDYNILMYGGRYPFGCNGDSRHKGVDSRPKASRKWGRWIADGGRWDVYAWGKCVVRVNGYDDGGYHRYMQLYFPEVNMTMTAGHLMNGTAHPVGTWFERGDKIAECGTKRDGLGARHVHYRVSQGDWKQTVIPPCRDMHPAVLFNLLNG